MENKKSNADYRKYPRIRRRFKFQLKMDDGIIPAETIDLSYNGALCSMDRQIPAMTRLNIVIELRDGDNLEYVQCNGVVIRSDEVQSDAGPSGIFQTAIFFDDIAFSELRKLTKFTGM